MDLFLEETMLRFGVLLVWLMLFVPFRAQLVQAGCENFVSGTVFLDLNHNGIQEPTEPYTSGLVRLEQSGQLYAEKLAEAEFGFVFASVPCGDYQVFVEGRYAADIQVSDAGPSQSLNLARTPYILYCPILKHST